MDGVWPGDERPVVGIVDRETEANPITEPSDDTLESVLDAHDATAVRGDLETVLEADPSLLIVAGETDLSAVARAGVDVPVLAVGDVPGIDTVDRDRVPTALEAVLERDADVCNYPILGLEIDADRAEADGTRERALFDVTLVADEPARISEYSVTSRGESVATFRADGVVAATSAGSHGYASALDAPQLSPAVDAVVVAPIAPFVTDTRRWVLPDDALTLTVERNECDVTIVADETPVETVSIGSHVTVSVVDTLATLVRSDRRGSSRGDL